MRKTSPSIAAAAGASPSTASPISRPCTRRSTSTCLASATASPSDAERRRAQVDDHRAQLLHRLARELADELQLRGRLRGVALEQRVAGFRREHDAEELLRDRVVQLAREPVSLLDDAQLARALVQARVLQRERGVGGERLDERLVGVGELGSAPSLSVR